MNIQRRLFIALACVLVVGASGGLALYPHFKKRATLPPKKDTFQGFIQGRGEAALKKRTALTLAVVYEKMLAQYPDNIELKKKLADAYTQAGQPEKASPLLDQITKSEQKNR